MGIKEEIDRAASLLLTRRESGIDCNALVAERIIKSVAHVLNVACNDGTTTLPGLNLAEAFRGNQRGRHAEPDPSYKPSGMERNSVMAIVNLALPSNVKAFLDAGDFVRIEVS